MGAKIFTGIIVLAVFYYYFHSNHKKFKQELQRIQNMDIERKKLELSKLQIKIEGKRTNHLLHFFIALFTLGFWIPCWIIVSKSNSSERKQLEKLVESI